jgi:hypothetical protein
MVPLTIPLAFPSFPVALVRPSPSFVTCNHPFSGSNQISVYRSAFLNALVYSGSGVNHG